MENVLNQGRYFGRELSTMLPKGGMFLPKEDLGIREFSTSTSSRVGKRLRFPGRILNILLGAEPRYLEKVRAQLNSSLQPKSLVGQAPLDLIDHVRDLDSSHSSVEQIFVPILEHVVKSKELSNRERSVYILHMLLEREEVGMKVASKLATVVSTDQTNNRVKLGWCLMVRKIVEAWFSWQHYGGQLLVEDKTFYTHPQPVLRHWLGALQETEDSNTEEQTRKTQEIRGYSLACLALTLGKLDSRRLEKILEELEPQLLNVLFSQLRTGEPYRPFRVMQLSNVILLRSTLLLRSSLQQM